MEKEQIKATSIINRLLRRNLYTKNEMIEAIGISFNTFQKRLSNSSWRKKEIDIIFENWK